MLASGSETRHGFIKGDAVVPSVGLRLVFVPLKLEVGLAVGFHLFPTGRIYPQALCTPTLSLPGTLGLLHDGGGGIGKHLAPQDNIRGVRILSEVMADAPDTRDE